MLGAYLMRKKGHWVIISHSRDGQIQTKIFKRFGYQVIRGSTGRGGERALVESLRVLKRGERMAITPDGPRGPDRQVQGGVLMMAKKTGAALIPVGTGARPCKLVPTWDSYMVPFLFAKACFAVGEPIYVPQDANDVTMEAKRLELQRAIEVVQAEAEEFVR